MRLLPFMREAIAADTCVSESQDSPDSRGSDFTSTCRSNADVTVLCYIAHIVSAQVGVKVSMASH